MTYRTIMIAVGLVFGILLAGCCAVNEERAESTLRIEPAPIDHSIVNRLVRESYSDLAIQNAIITQHSLYPYHFINNSAELNALGKRDLAILAGHFLEHPGQICLRQGHVDRQLYQARSKTVRENLLQAGIAKSKINITGGHPGGQGMPSPVVVEILQATKMVPGGTDMNLRY